MSEPTKTWAWIPAALGAVAALFALNVPPFIVVIAAGLLMTRLPAYRGVLALVSPVLALALIWGLPDTAGWQWAYLDYHLVLAAPTDAARLMGTVFCLALFCGGWFALAQAGTLELPAAYVYAGSALGVLFAGDWISVFIFWEIMAIASTLVIWAGGTERAWAAAQRYILVHLLGGVLFMAGLAALLSAGGGIAIGPIALEGIGAWLVLGGVLVNVGAPPLWAWVSDAYPEASPSGSVFLSAFTTKTAVFVLWVAFPGTELLIPVGLFMIVYGIVWAVMEDNARRVLAYSLVSQVGYMVTAIGVGSPLALAGALAHAFAHIGYKALLFMAVGAAIRATGEERLSRMGGLARQLPWAAAAALVGGLALAATPLTAGYVAKVLITEAVAEAHHTVAWLVLYAASAAAMLYVGLRIPLRVFFAGPAREAAPLASTPNGPMVTMMAVILAVGLSPHLLYGLLPFPVDVHPYGLGHLLPQLQILAFSVAITLLFVDQLGGSAGRTLDLDWLYRRPGFALLRGFVGSMGAVGRLLERLLSDLAWALVRWLFRHHGPEGRLAHTWPTGSMVLWVSVILVAALVFYFR